MMISSQASAPRDGVRLIAVRLAGSAALAAFDRAWAAGAAVLPLDPHADRGSAQHAAAVLGAAEFVDGASTTPLPDAAPVPDGTALVIRTSGTTGTPRGVVLSHEALRAAVTASLRRLACEAGDRWLCVLPLHHVAGVLVALRARALGSEPIIHPTFDVSAIAGEAAATHVALVPTMLHRLLDEGVDVSHYRCILLGGAAPPPRLLERARAAGAHVVTTYGMTETSGGCVYDGMPLDGVAVAVDPEGGDPGVKASASEPAGGDPGVKASASEPAGGDPGVLDGRVLLRGPVLASGYRTGRTIQKLTTDGWFRTSDLGHWRDGRLVVTGRTDDVIVTGGVNVSTAAVATILQGHTGVADASVIGVDDLEWGQRLVAYVVPADPARPPSREQLRDFVRARAMPAYTPRDVIVVPALPRTSLGKVDRGALQSRILGDGGN